MAVRQVEVDGTLVALVFDRVLREERKGGGRHRKEVGNVDRIKKERGERRGVGLWVGGCEGGYECVGEWACRRVSPAIEVGERVCRAEASRAFSNVS